MTESSSKLGWLTIGQSFPTSLVATGPESTSILQINDTKETKRKRKSKKTTQQLYRDDSSDSSGDELLAKGMKLLESSNSNTAEVVFLPNGDVSLTSERTDQPSWSFDKRRDNELAMFGSYRLDIPFYKFTDGLSVVSNTDIARRSYRQPSGIVASGQYKKPA